MRDDHLARAPFAQQESGLIAVARTREHLGLRRIALQIADQRQIFLLLGPVPELEGAILVTAAQKRLHVHGRVAKPRGLPDQLAADVAVHQAGQMVDAGALVRNVRRNIGSDHLLAQTAPPLTIRREIGVLHDGTCGREDREDLFHLAVGKCSKRIVALAVALRNDRNTVAEGGRSEARVCDRAAVHKNLAAVKVDVVIQ